MSSISFLQNEVYGGWSPKTKFIAGSEQMTLFTAIELSKRGHEVSVYHNTDTDFGVYEGVNFRPREEFKKADLTIIVKDYSALGDKEFIYWTNETDIEQKVTPDMAKLFIAHSEWQKKNIMPNLPNTIVIPLGATIERVESVERVPKQVLYASAPDRGLEILLKDWKRIEDETGATLKVTYNDGLDAEDMTRLFNESDIWAYPCIGGELYCITGINAQKCGCVPVIIPTMALSETVRWGYKTDKENFTNKLIQILNQNNEELRSKMMRDDYPTWSDVADQFEELI